MKTIEIPQQVKDYIEKIQGMVEGHYKVYLCGGYLRDMYLGRTPKDIDLMFSPSTDSPEDVESLTGSYLLSQGVYQDYNKRFMLDENSDMKARGVCQLLGLKDYSLDTSEVQFIVYDKEMSQEDLMSDMDMGIVQVTYSIEKGVTGTDNFWNDHSNKVIKCYHTYNKERMYDRYRRMEEKMPEYSTSGKPYYLIPPAPRYSPSGGY